MFRCTINIVSDSEAEDYFVKVCCPKLKDKYYVRLGAIWGLGNINQYDISIFDRFRIRKEIRKMYG